MRKPSSTSFHPRIHAVIPSMRVSFSFSYTLSTSSKCLLRRHRRFRWDLRGAVRALASWWSSCQLATQRSSPRTVPLRLSSSIESSRMSDCLRQETSVSPVLCVKAEGAAYSSCISLSSWMILCFRPSHLRVKRSWIWRDSIRRCCSSALTAVSSFRRIAS